MSSVSAITDDLLPQRKLAVHLAENGHSFEFMCDCSTLVEEIQHSIESLYGILRSDQLLFCRNLALEPQQTLGYYKLPQVDCEVFVYKKSSFHSDSPLPPVEIIEFPESREPPQPSLSQTSHPLDNATDPALKALASYEKLFRYHFQLANSILSRTQSKLEICKRLLREQQVQERALEAVRGIVDLTFRKLQQRYNDFTRCYSTQHRCHSEILANLGRDIERLRLMKLHPALQSESQKCLLDFVKEDWIRKWANDCAALHQSFEGMVSDLKVDFRELKKSVDDVLSGMMSGTGKDVESAVQEHQQILSSLNSIMQSLGKDVDTVKKHVDECLGCQPSASVRSHDAISGLGRIYNSHEADQIPRVESCDHAMTRLLDKCKNKKNEMNLLVHSCMQRVKSVQIRIKDMNNQLHGFQEVVGRQDQNFESLKSVNGISHAYRACLAEVVRRKSYLKLYMGLAGQLAERLATEREAEVRRRDDFYKSWGKYMPHEILSLMGLFDSPRQCDINIAPFDTSLLDIDVMDVDRFAPQHAVGLLVKSERSESPRSPTLSSENNCLAKSKESAMGSSSRCESVADLDLCETVDIAGTSKMEVENAWLKAELASAIAVICSFGTEVGYESLDDGERDDILKKMTEKTNEALRLKDEYAKHLQSRLDTKQVQCLTYEKRIQELEQRLSDRYSQLHKLSASKDGSESTLSDLKTDGCTPHTYGDGEAQMPDVSTEPMDDASFTSASLDPKTDQICERPGKSREGGDENMADLSGSLHMLVVDSQRNTMDSSMVEPPCDVQAPNVIVEFLGKGSGENMLTTELNVKMTDSSSNDPHVKVQACGTDGLSTPDKETTRDFVLGMQETLESTQGDVAERQIKAAEEEISSLKRELEMSRKLLDESQMNCAHLENCLHEAREEAHTNLCAADRRASEYNTLRATAVKMRGLFERFRSSVAAPSFADSLRSLAVSLPSSSSEDGDDATAELRACIRILSDIVGGLTRHRADAAHERLVKELEEKNELIKNLFTKHQLKKQESKEKISFGHFEVDELAAFVRNPSTGHYEAINSNSSNYYLSAESVALFGAEHTERRPAYIIGQIVHIERRAVRPLPSALLPQADRRDEVDPRGSPERGRPPPLAAAAPTNPYNLPPGCEYFVVTIAMLPDNTIHSSPS